MQESLFKRPSESSEGLRVPKFSEIESNLGYCVYKEVPRGLGVMDDTPVTIREFTIPIVLGVDKNGKEIHYTYRTQQYFEGCPEMINAWMKDGTSYGHSFELAKDWIRENADELNYARRYFIMKNIERDIQEKEESLRLSKIALNIKILQVQQDRWIYGEEQDKLFVEFGGTLDQ